nr:HAMP domain-containing histidine kinase [Chthoniobacterales bacterium]
ALCYVEGGLRGHAVAWLASVPLCALLLVGKKASGVWVMISFAAAASVVAFDLAEIRLPVLYDPAWGPLVDATGYLGLIAFMFGLGLIFELGRVQAFGKMTDALSATAAANERLSVANKEKTEFMGVAAHDLRNPLTIIITYAEMLREGNARKPKEFADSIYQAGRRMKGLITNLLDANAIDEGRFSCEIERCEIAPLIATSVSQNQINATRKKTEIVLLPAPQLWARTDRGVTVQILDNLISNAVKYAPPKARVFIESGYDEGRVFASVRDQGPGISEADQAQLFRKYTRLTARPTGGESSTGLGLSIVKRLVEALRGSIECQSELGAGATFTVRLPAWNDNVI